jgi:hypothetical protein
VAKTVFTQVYAPDGTWVGFFNDDADARSWVGKQQDSHAYEVTKRRPSRKEG